MRDYCILALAGILCTAGVAGAATTYSPPVRSSEGDNLRCQALNLSDAPVEVSAELHNGLGAVADTGTLTIPAGEGRLVASSSAAIFGGYCSFAFEGDPAAVRGFIALEDAGGSNTRLLYPAEPIAGDPPVGITTFSPPVRSSEGDNLRCQVLNLSDAPIQVGAELHNGLGAIADTGMLTIPAGEGRLVASSSSAIFGGYCSFAFEGDPTAVRGFIALEDAGGSNTRLLFPARSAQAAPPATATATPPLEATPTATSGAGGCCGDCDGNLEVTINELITAVNNALGTCP